MNKIDSFTGEYRFLSNFFPILIEMDGGIYQSVEHAYQAAKTLDLKLRDILKIDKLTAGQAKKLGSIFPLRSDWESIKIRVMKELLKQKFGPSQFGTNPLMVALQKTGDAELIEGNTWNDTFWGVCRGKGSNHLGRLLMEIRESLPWVQY